MSSLTNNRLMLCPDCKREICEIVSLFLSFNKIPMVKLRCRCNSYQILNISLVDYIKQINNAPFNNIRCIKHPTIQECNVFCVDCKHWICSECEKTHEIRHIKYHTNSITLKFCNIHHSKMVNFHCNKCHRDLCDLCAAVHELGHPLVRLDQYWEETYKKLSFKNTDDLSKFFEEKIKKIEEYKNHKKNYLDQTIRMLEKLKNDIEREYDVLMEKNKNLYEMIKIAYNNFFMVKNHPNYCIIKNINMLQFHNSINKENLFEIKKNGFNQKFQDNKIPENNDYLLNNLILNVKNEVTKRINHDLIISITQDSNIKSISPFNSLYSQKILHFNFSHKKTFYKKCQFTLKHINSIYDVIELSNGNIASCSSDNTIKIWCLSSEQCLQTLEGHKGTVLSLCQLKDSRLVSCSEDKTIKIWSLSTMSWERDLLGHEEPIHTVIQLHNGTLASGSSDTTIKIWNINTYLCICTIVGHLERIYRIIEIKPGVIASSSYDKSIKVWELNLDASSYQCLQTLTGHKSYVWSITKIKGYHNDYNNDNIIASGSTDSTIKVWDIEEEDCLFTLTGHLFTVIALIQGNNGTLISGSYDKTIKIWDLEEQVCVTTLVEHNNAIWVLRQLKNGNLVSASWDTTLKIWD